MGGAAGGGILYREDAAGMVNESSLLEGALANKCFSHSALDSNGDESIFTVCSNEHVKQTIPAKSLS